MKKAVIAGFLALVVLCGASVCAEQSAVTYARLILDLVDAYERPSQASVSRIDADAEALEDDVARSMAEHWKETYLNREYRPLHYGTDDAALLPIPERGARHAFAVLGYELLGGEMTDELKGRCRAAAAAAKAFPLSILVCSGGATGVNNPEKRTEAGLMKAYLENECGLDAERVFTDEYALTTTDNALNTLAILEKQDIQSITIVTSSYHMLRGQTLFAAANALYKKEKGFSVESIGGYCFDTEPSTVSILREDLITAYQLGLLLNLPQEQMISLSSALFQYMSANPAVSE